MLAVFGPPLPKESTIRPLRPHALGVLLTLTLVVADSARAATIRVPADAPDLQAGLDAASAGDSVVVAPGNYSGAGNVDLSFGGQDIVLVSEAGSAMTIIQIDGTNGGTEHRGFVFAGGETPAARVEGFTISMGGAGEGGGAACTNGSSPTFERCVFSMNDAADGGGVFADGASPGFTDCRFERNTPGLGGGVYLRNSQTVFLRCAFESNGTDSGGGAAVFDSSVEFVDCEFLDNVVADLGDVWGGALWCGNSTVLLERCNFTGNDADGVESGDRGFGGAVAAIVCNLTVRSCTFAGNIADVGGVLYVSGGSVDLGESVLWGNDAWQNGGGVACWDGAAAQVRNSTLYANTSELGSGISVDAISSVALENTIVAFGEVGEAITCAGAGLATLVCSDVFENAGGDWVGCLAGQLGMSGNIADNPLFCNPIAGDFTISSQSPCAPAQSGCGLIGALGPGCNSSPVLPTTWGALKASFR